ncbi:MAG: DUF1566 domain-containing protein [Balneolales bacterium]|nr:DUF1566 domain-containing protein [Balneolales bacterium]
MHYNYLSAIILLFFLTSCSSGPQLPVQKAEEEVTISLRDMRNLMTVHSAQAVSQSTIAFEISWAEVTQTPVLANGVCVHTTQNPTVAHTCSPAPSASGRVSLRVSGLEPGQTYYARPYITTAFETVYGGQSVVTTDEAASVRVTSSDLISYARPARSAVLRGIVTGTTTEGSLRRGFVWGSTDPLRQPEETVEIADGRPFQLPLTNLQFGIEYYFRAFAITEQGTIYGETITFVFPPYEIGDIGPAGGIIFFYDEQNRYPFTFLEAAPAGWGGLRDDLRAEFPCYNRFLDVTDFRIGAGPGNLRRLLERCANQPNNIARLVADLNIEGFSDWYIPTRAEVELMLENLYQRGNAAGLSNEFYWSSSEQDDGAAWGIFMGTGNHRLLPKWMQERVRPVRAF